MSNRKLTGLVMWGIVWVIAVASSRGAVPAKSHLIGPPTPVVVRTWVLDWLAARGGIDRSVEAEVAKLWALGDRAPSPATLFDRTMTTFCLADRNTKAFVEACRLQRPPLLAPRALVLEDGDLDPFYSANVRLFYGRYLAQRKMFENALAILDAADPAQMIDPASFLFYKAVCQHHLLLKTEGLKTLEQLLKHTEGVPIRYSTVATLMQDDLQGLQEESLDELSRKMHDVQRRLGLGRSGPKVQKIEEEIVAGLDEMIKKLAQQAGGSNASGTNQSQSSKPAEESIVKGRTAPGTVDPKKFKLGGKWGGLDDKLRTRVKQLIGRDFPAHYRRAVEEYFRKAAKRSAPN